jgi:hypothetical protein
MTEFDHADRSGQVGSKFDELKRSPQEDINRARQAAEALFAPKQQTKEPADPAAVSATDQPTRKPRILSAVPAKRVPVESVSSSLKLVTPSKRKKIPAAHFARIRTWLKYGMTISQVADTYEVPIEEIESIVNNA